MTLHRPSIAWLSSLLILGLAAGCATSVSGSADVTATSSTDTSPSVSGAAQQLRSNLPRQTAGNPASAGSALATFGSALLQQLPATGNEVLSPYSVYAVLAMARAGAEGATGTQLDKVLGGSSAEQTQNLTAVDAAVAAALASGAAPTGADPTTTDTRPERVDVANSVWISPALQVQPTYLDRLATGFGVGMYKIDYAADPESARKTINGWVSDHTQKLIPELLQQNALTTDTVMTLVNAMYLSAPWQQEFNPDSQKLAFTTAAGTTVQTPGIVATSGFATAAGKGWTSVTVPYRGGKLAMTIVLPDAGSFNTIRAELPSVLADAASARVSQSVNLTMPTFKSQTHLSLTAAVRKLGVTNLFDSSADLSGIAGKPGEIYATDLVHQSVISVDEKGTEAAAATALTMTATGAPAQPKKVAVDRPFFYSISDTTTGAPLFLGQITDPTA